MFPVGGPGVLAGAGGLTALVEVDSRIGLVVTGGAVVAGVDVEEWRGRGATLLQDTASARPATVAVPGRLMVELADDERLEATVGSAVRTVVLLFGAPDAAPLGDRVLVTRDTSASTAKAALEVSLVSYFG